MVGYIDLKTLYEGDMAVYCRVSTSGQNINQQISLAEVYFTQKHIDTEKVQYYLDDNVSANKLALDKRPELNRLVMEIKKGKIKTVVVQSRDRLARNFYEYIDLVKEFYKYNVQVIFTDSGQSKFSKVLSVEALYGIFAQTEGRNIANKTISAALHFPNSIWGFNVTGKKNTKKYTPNPDMESIIKSLFYSVMNINSADEMIELIKKYKKEIKKSSLKLLACLKSPFYAGHIKIQEQYVQLPHVEPIISLEDYFQVQECLLKFEKEIQASIAKSSEKGLLHPICSYCKTVMSSRSSNLGDSVYYVCAKKGHPRISLEVSRYNQLISEHLAFVLNRINVKQIKKDVFAFVLAQEKQSNKLLSLKENQLKASHKKITNLLGTSNKRKINLLVEQSKLVEEEMKQIHTRLIQIEEARKGINFFVNTVNEQLINELQNYQQEYLIQMLFSKMELSSESIIYHTNFGDYIEGDEKCDEHRT